MLDPSQLPVWYPAPPYPPLPDPVYSEIVVPGPGGPYILSEELWFPLRPLDLVRQHLQVALRQIQSKRLLLDRRWSYYLGKHSEKVLSRKLHETLGTTVSNVETLFSNYCGLVVDAPLARLKVVGWAKGTQDAVAAAADVWEDNDLDLEGEEIHRHAIAAGEVYVLVWARTDPDTGAPEFDETGRPLYDLSLQDARLVHVEYRSRRRRDRAWAAKIWLDWNTWRAILYYPDEIIRLQTAPHEPPGPCPQDPTMFFPDEADSGGPHAFGSVPMVRFSRTWDGRSRLDDVIPVQDRINRLTADKVVAAEFGAFPQRWALTNDDPPPDALRAGPGGVWVIPPRSVSTDGGEEAPTTVGQFPSADLLNYDQTIQRETNALFSIAQLPRHLLVDPGVAPSGEAVLADEAPMVAQVRGYRDMFTASWRDVMNLIGLEVEPAWQDIEVHNELTSAQTLQALTTAGLPLRMAAEIALELPEDQLAELEKLGVPPQPGAAVPGQNAQPAPSSQDEQGAEDQGASQETDMGGRPAAPDESGGK